MEGEITGYELNEPHKIQEKREKLLMVMKDIQWRSHNQTLHTEDDFLQNDVIQSKKQEQIEQSQLLNPREQKQKETEFNKNNNLTEYFKGNTSYVYVNRYDELTSLSADTNQVQSSNAFSLLNTNHQANFPFIHSLQSNLNNINNQSNSITQSIIMNKPSPSQIANLYDLIEKPFDINEINKASVSNDYWNLLNENVGNNNYIVSNANRIPCENVSQLPIYSNINTNQSSNDPFVQTVKPNHFIPQLPIHNLFDWIVDCTEDEFQLRRYQFLCSINQITLSDPVSLVVSSLNKNHLTRRCILFSDLAELQLLDLSILFTKLSNIHHENVPILVKNIFSTNSYVSSHQNYLMYSIIDMQMEEDDNDNEEENGKKKTTKKRTNKKKTKKTKKVKQHEKDKQIEKEKRVQEFGILTEEMDDVELVNHYRENQLKTKEFIVDLYKSNNSSITTCIQKINVNEQQMEIETNENIENTNQNENTNNTNTNENNNQIETKENEQQQSDSNEESVLTAEHQSEVSEHEEQSEQPEHEEENQKQTESNEEMEEENEIIKLINSLIKTKDWYHFVIISIELLHPAIVKKSIGETELIINKLLEHISVIYYHPKIMNLINCCYSLTRSSYSHIPNEIKGKTFEFLSMLLDYIDKPTGNLLKISEQLETQIKRINEIKGEKYFQLNEFTETEFENKINGLSDEKVQMKYIIGTLLNLLYDRNKEHFTVFFNHCKKNYPMYPLSYLLCKYMCSHIHISQSIEQKCIDLITDNILSIGTLIKQFIQPSLKQALKNNDQQKIIICCRIISELMTKQNEKGEQLWNIRISEMIIDQIIQSLHLLNQSDINELFINSFGGNINEFITIHKEKVFQLLKGKNKEKIISGLFWKPNTLYTKGEISMNYIEEHQCNLSSISLIFSIISIEGGVDLFLHVLLSQNYSLTEMKTLIEEMNSEIFTSEIFVSKIIEMLDYMNDDYSDKSTQIIDNFIMEELEEWYNKYNDDIITCSQCMVNGFFYVLLVLFKYNQSIELLSHFISFITLPLFTKDDTETFTSLLSTICESKNNQMEIEITNQDTQETELQRNKLLINAIIVYLMKFNHNAVTTDLFLIDKLLETLSLLFENSLQYAKGKELIVLFDEEIKKKECCLSLLNYIHSQLPCINQIVMEMKANDINDDMFEIRYYPKQQHTYANLIHEPKIIPFDQEI